MSKRVCTRESNPNFMAIISKDKTLEMIVYNLLFITKELCAIPPMTEVMGILAEFFMNINQMLEKLVCGKKITHDHWDNDSFIEINDNDELIDESGNNYSITEFVQVSSPHNTGWHLFNRRKKENVASKNIPLAGTLLQLKSCDEAYTVLFSNDKVIFYNANNSDHYYFWDVDYWKSTARLWFKSIEKK